MLHAMNHGGRIAALGIPAGPMALDINDVIFKGLEIQAIYGRRIFETWYKMAAMLQSGLDVSAIITHQLPADSSKKPSTSSTAVNAARSSSTGLEPSHRSPTVTATMARAAKYLLGRWTAKLVSWPP
jgi:threonine dehydrogenase-like Zn-dependent dehydrogenase